MANHEHYGDWKNKKKLGSGGFGQVCLWENTRTGEKIAIKVCRPLRQSSRDRWQQEIAIMQTLDHRGLVRYCKIPDEIQENFSDNNVALGMEFCEQGDLRRVLISAKNCCGLEEPCVKDLLMDIGSAIHYLHSRKIVHRDIKPENIVLKDYGNGKMAYKLIDLGYAKEFSDQSGLQSFVGTLHYLAPEFYNIQPLRYTKTVDFWSFGLVAFECATGRRPFYPDLDLIRFLSDLRDRKQDIHICTVNNDCETAHPTYATNIPQPHRLNPIFTSKLENWLKLMLKLNPDARGKRDGESAWFEDLEKMLSEKIVRVYNTATHATMTFAIDDTTSVNLLKTRIHKESSIEMSDQILLFEDGNIPDPTKKVAVQCWPNGTERQKLLYLFSYQTPPSELRLPIDNQLIRYHQDKTLPNDADLQKRRLKHLLGLCASALCKTSASCDNVLRALKAIFSSFEKYRSRYENSAAELERCYYIHHGQLYQFMNSIQFDIHMYRNTDERSYGLGHDNFYNNWCTQMERVNSWSLNLQGATKSVDEVKVHRAAITIMASTVQSWLDACPRRQQYVDKFTIEAYEKYDRIRPRIRSDICDAADAVWKLIDQTVIPAVDAVTKVVKDYSDQITKLLPYHRMIFERNSQLPQHIRMLKDWANNLWSSHEERQRNVWTIVESHKAEMSNMHATLVESQSLSGSVGYSEPLEREREREWDANLQSMTQLLDELKMAGDVSDLDWEFAQHETAGNPGSAKNSDAVDAPAADLATPVTVNGPASETDDLEPSANGRAGT